MREIFHIYWGTSGNSGLYLDEIYQALKEVGYNQKLFVSYYYPFDYGEKIFFRHSDMAHCKLKGYKRKLLQLYEILTAFIRILFSCWKEKPAVVNYSLISGSYFFVIYFLRLIKLLSGCKLVITCHDVCPWGSPESNLSEMKNRQRIFDMADFLLVHNESSINDLKKVFSVEHNKIVKHLFPIMDLTKIHSVERIDKQCDFLFIGHLRKDKGIQFLVDSWEDVYNRGCNATLWICGRPQGQHFDEEKLKGMNVTLNLEYISEDDYCRYIQSARYVVLPYLMGTNSGIISTVLPLGANVITSDIPMFQDNPLVGKSNMFKSGDMSSLVDLMVAKYKSKEDNWQEDKLQQYREQFNKEVVDTYRQILQ